MAGGNMSPRQKMIGMMYLVLTALLALNVSKEILDAFILVNDGLETTTKNFGKKNQTTYDAFAFAKGNNEAKVGPYYNKAMQAKKYSQELYTYIEDLKKDLMVKTDKLPETAKDTMNLKHLASKDDANVPGEILILKGKAKELRGKMNEYKKNLEALLVGLRDAKGLNLGLETKDPPPSAEHGTQTWEMQLFDHVPLAAVITLLSKIQADVKNAEADVVNFLFKSVDASDFKFDTLVAKVVAPSSYVLIGNAYTADVFVAAYSSTQDPDVIVGGQKIKVEGGVGKYETRPNTEGLVKWGGEIKIKSPDGTIKSYPFEQSFIAAKPSMVVSATKMNVLYIGVENPMSISVPGVPAEKVTAKISQGSLVPDPKGPKGTYIAKVSSVGEANISVVAQLEEGKPPVPMGTVKYRSKMVPDPVAKIQGKKGGPIDRGSLIAAGAIIPTMENFDFELFFKVTSFTMTRAGKGRDPFEGKVDGNQMSEAMKDVIRNTRMGDKIYFENIKAVGPDGTPRQLSSVNFVIQ